jgi:hypothetical protein
MTNNTALRGSAMDKRPVAHVIMFCFSLVHTQILPLPKGDVRVISEG